MKKYLITLIIMPPSIGWSKCSLMLKSEDSFLIALYDALKPRQVILYADNDIWQAYPSHCFCFKL